MRSPRAWRAGSPGRRAYCPARDAVQTRRAGRRQCRDATRRDAAAASAAAADPRQRRGQRRRLDRLGQVVVHAGGEAFLAVAGHGVGGQRHDRHPPRRPGQRPDRPRRREAVEHRHLHVHQHDVVAAAGRRRDRGAAVGDRLHAVPAGMQEGADQILVGGVVLGEQHPERRLRVGGARRRRRVLGPRRAAGPGADREAEDAALARRARHRDLAAHQLDELLGDREPEAGAAGAPGERVVDLHELLEHLAGLPGGNADAGVADLDAEPAVPAQASVVGADRDRPGLGELGGVAERGWSAPGAAASRR